MSNPGPIRRWTLLAFSLPAILQGFMHAPAQSLIQGIYAKHAGVPLAALGTAVLLTRIFDGVIDPFIGIASDAWHRRTGSRKALIAIGTPIMVLGLWFLYRPPENVSIAYFTAWFMVAYLGWTITEIPYRAWSMELSTEYVLRTRIQTWLSVGTTVGTFLFFIVPYAASALGGAATTELNLHTLAVCAVTILIAAPLANFIALTSVPNGKMHSERPRVSLRELWTAIAGNGPLIYFTGMFMLTGVVIGMTQGVAYLYVDGYLGLGDKLAGVILLTAPITLLCIPLWGWMCQRFERQKVWAICTALAGLCTVGYGFIPPGPAGLVPVIMVSVTSAVLITCTYVAVPAMVGDVIDYGRWKFNHDHGGLYIAFYTLISKSVSGIGIALGFILLDLFGYDAKAPVQSEQGVIAMKLTAAWIPALGIALAAPFIWFFPIRRARHAQMIRDIEARAPLAVEPAPTRVTAVSQAQPL